MLKVAVSGAGGKMGRRLVALISCERDMKVAAAIDAADSPFIGKDSGVLAGIGENNVTIKDHLDSRVSVLIDFSSPEGVLRRLEECVRLNCPIVIGTTGLDAKVTAKIRAASGKISCLVSPNMSVGMNVLFNLAGELAAALGPDYDIEIIEAHHRQKKDAPSGTALNLAKKICDKLGRNLEGTAVYGRRGQIGERKDGEIGIFSVRGGDIVGEHRVIYVTEGETVEVSHRAHSRDTFVRGAIRAARFIARARKGLYSMEDAAALHT